MKALLIASLLLGTATAQVPTTGEWMPELTEQTTREDIEDLPEEENTEQPNENEGGQTPEEEIPEIEIPQPDPQPETPNTEEAEQPTEAYDDEVETYTGAYLPSAGEAQTHIIIACVLMMLGSAGLVFQRIKRKAKQDV